MSSNDVDCRQNEKWLVVGEVRPSPHNKWNHLRATNNTLMMLMLITMILKMLIMMKSLVVRGSPSPHNKWNHLRATILKQEILTSSGGDLDLEIFVDLCMLLHTFTYFCKVVNH